MEAVWIGPVRFGGGDKLALVAGPCVIEDREQCLQIARHLAAVGRRLGVGVVFKASFDKANRTSGESYRGPGLERGLAVLAAVQEETGLPTITDIHEPYQAEPAAAVVAALQIPAFLCRQTDLLVAAARTGRPVAIKKGQFLAPEDMAHPLAKVRAEGAACLLVERGTSFGYHNLVVDMRALATLRGLGAPVVFDATHAVQLPGGAGAASGGERQFIAPLARAAAAVGIDGLFLEVHPHPEQAQSDAGSQLPLAELEPLLEAVLAVDAAMRAGRQG